MSWHDSWVSCDAARSNPVGTNDILGHRTPYGVTFTSDLHLRSDSDSWSERREKNSEGPVVWNLPGALDLVREMQPIAWAHGYAICIGGGVVNKGESTNDLDLVLMESVRPNKEVSDLDGLLREFSKKGHKVTLTCHLFEPKMTIYRTKTFIDLIVPNFQGDDNENLD